MKHSKKLVALMVLCLMVLNSVAVFAADGDVWTKMPAPGQKYGAAADVILDSNKLDPILLTPEDYWYEMGGKVYEMTDLNDEFNKDEKNYLSNLASNKPGVPIPGNVSMGMEFLDANGKEKNTLVANGRDGVVVKLKVMDKNGVLNKDADDMTATVHTTFGKLAKEKVTIQDGTAEVYLTSETLTQPRTAVVTAIITDAGSKYAEYINVKAEGRVLMDPNPVSVERGAKLADAESDQADRIIMFFDKEVSAGDFKEGKYKVVLKTSVKSSDTEAVIPHPVLETELTEADVKAILPVENNNRALLLLLDVEKQKMLIDNAKINLTFTNLLMDKVAGDTGKAIFNLTDARKPEMTKVVGTNDAKASTITVTFSEAVYYYKDKSEMIDATKPENWAIDGKLLSTMKVKEIKVGELDKRNVVTITLDELLSAGKHSIQAANIGDWAAKTDIHENVMDTQTLDFSIGEGPGEVGKELRVLWAYADKDEEPVENNGYISDDVDKKYDYIRIRFNQPLRVDGRDTTALSNDNYTLNGSKFPIGTQIVFDKTMPEDAYIEPALKALMATWGDTFETGNNSEIKIILPQDTIKDPETTVINISGMIEAAAGDGKGGYIKLSNPDEYKLPLYILNKVALTPEEQQIQDVMDMIKALPDPSTIVDETTAKAAQPDVLKARAAYNALKPEQQAKVKNLKKLEDLEAAIKAHVKDVMTVEAKMANFGASVNVTAVTDSNIVTYKVFKADGTTPAMKNAAPIGTKRTAFYAGINAGDTIVFVGYDAADKEVARQTATIASK